MLEMQLDSWPMEDPLEDFWKSCTCIRLSVNTILLPRSGYRHANKSLA